MNLNPLTNPETLWFLSEIKPPPFLRWYLREPRRSWAFFAYNGRLQIRSKVKTQILSLFLFYILFLFSNRKNRKRNKKKYIWGYMWSNDALKYFFITEYLFFVKPNGRKYNGFVCGFYSQISNTFCFFFLFLSFCSYCFPFVFVLFSIFAGIWRW